MPPSFFQLNCVELKVFNKMNLLAHLMGRILGEARIVRKLDNGILYVRIGPSVYKVDPTVPPVTIWEKGSGNGYPIKGKERDQIIQKVFRNKTAREWIVKYEI